MAKDIWPDDFHCPKCGKSKHTAGIGVREYAMQRLDLPYFICGDCRICSYSKQLIKQVIQRWRKDCHPVVSYSQIFMESKAELERIMKYYVSIGYRLRRFKRK